MSGTRVLGYHGGMAVDFDNPIRKVTLNGDVGGPEIAAELIAALSDKKILTEKAGFLFKATVQPPQIYLGVVPYFIGNRRMTHYGIELPVENDGTLIGDVNADGHFTLLFPTAEATPTPEQKIACAESLILFARFLTANGYVGKGQLDWITLKYVKEAGLFNSIPQTLAELARHPRPEDA